MKTNSKGSGKMQLSKSILEMKFMKKTKEKVALLQFQAEGEEYFENALTTRLKKESGKYTIEPSYVFCEQLIDGRLSFRGMNPEIEKNMEHESKLRRSMRSDKLNECDVSDEQMAKNLNGSHMRTVEIKFHGKRSRSKVSNGNDDDETPPKKPRFMRPSE